MNAKVDQIVAYNTFWKNGVVGLLCLVMFANFSSYLLTPARPDKALWIGWIFSLCALIFYARRFFDPRPQVVANEAGISAVRMPGGELAWGDITEIGFRTVQGDLWLTLSVRDEEIWSKHANSLQKCITQVFGRRTLLLTVALYNMTVDSPALVALIRRKVAVK